jgi:hypothetical protein
MPLYYGVKKEDLDELFNDGERLAKVIAKEVRKSRNEQTAMAVASFVSRHKHMPSEDTSLDKLKDWSRLVEDWNIAYQTAHAEKLVIENAPEVIRRHKIGKTPFEIAFALKLNPENVKIFLENLTK